jgi:hypothetical protein
MDGEHSTLLYPKFSLSTTLKDHGHKGNMFQYNYCQFENHTLIAWLTDSVSFLKWVDKMCKDKKDNNVDYQ